jgi:hypothetical protein
LRGLIMFALLAILILLRPSGAELDTIVKGIEHIRYAKMPEKITFPILLPEDITKDDIPVGADVLLLEERCETGS